MKKTAGQIFIFSVGINRYASDDVHNLSGCVDDVMELQALLKDHLNIPDHHCVCLVDEKATRKNIITRFRKHFSKLQEGDVAIFHYSGHGSWEWTTPEFQGPPFETPGGRNEMLLSHDFAVDGVLGLADKELRYLISEIQYPKHKVEKKVHFVGLMDCCFSGSMFRRVDNVVGQIEGETIAQIRKSAPDDPSPRPLAAYLEGQYNEMLLTDGQITLPSADYVLLSASSHGEPANEDEDGGFFTQALIRVLTYKKQEGKYPTYAELHFLISASIQRKTDYQQHPYLEYSGNISPYDSFAKNGSINHSLLPAVRIDKKSKEGLVNLGALHGLELQKWRHADLPVYQKMDTLIRVGTARLKQVQVEQSMVSFSPNDKFDAAHSDGLVVGLHAKSLGIKYIITEDDGQDTATSLHYGLLEKIKERGLGVMFQENNQAEYSIDFSSQTIAIYKEGELLIAISAPFQSSDFDLIIDILHKIARWEQLMNLETPKDSEVDLEKVRFVFSYYDYGGKEKAYEIGPTDNEKGVNEIYIPYDDHAEDGGAILYEIKVGHDQLFGHMELYFYLIHLDKKFSIKQKFETLKALMPLAHDLKNSYEYISENDNLGLGIVDKNEEKTFDVFSLIVSAEPLMAPYLFEQKGLGDMFGATLSVEDRRSLIKKDGTSYKGEETIPVLWAIKQLRVHLIKNKNYEH